MRHQAPAARNSFTSGKTLNSSGKSIQLLSAQYPTLSTSASSEEKERDTNYRTNPTKRTTIEILPQKTQPRPASNKQLTAAAQIVLRHWKQTASACITHRKTNRQICKRVSPPVTVYS